MTDIDPLLQEGNDQAVCPYAGGAFTQLEDSQPSAQWWPNQLNLRLLHAQPPASNPLGEEFDYAEEFGVPRPRCAEERRHGSHDRLTALVAG